MNGLGGRIRELRTERGITQRELAEPRYSRGFLAAVESGHRVPTDEALSYLAGRLGVDPEDLRHGRPAGAAETLREELAEARRKLSHGNTSAAAEMIESARARAEAYGLTEVTSQALLGLGDVRLQENGPETAVSLYETAMALEPQGSLRARLIARIGQCAYLHGDSAKAIEISEKALYAERFSPPVEPEVELVLLGSLIYPCLEVGAVERARRAVDEGLALLPRVENKAAIADFYVVAAQSWHADGRLSEVDVALNTAREIFTRLDWEREIGRCHWTRGYVLVRMDRLAEASDELELARDILSRVGAKHFHGGATAELAEVRRRQSRFDEAEALAQEAMTYLVASGYDEGIAEIDRLLGRIAMERGDLPLAEELLNRAAQRYAGAGLNNELMRTCRELGGLLIAQDRLDEAFAVLQRGVTCV